MLVIFENSVYLACHYQFYLQNIFNIMKKILIALILFANLQSFGQVAFPNIPVDKETKLITYDDVVDQKGVSAKELYSRATAWYQKYFNNPTEKLRKKDDENFTLELFVRFKLYNFDKKGVKSDASELMQYTLNIACKEGRYKYEFTKFNQKAPSFKPSEPLLDKNDPNAEKHTVWLKQVDEEIKKTINDLEKAMATSGEKKKDDW